MDEEDFENRCREKELRIVKLQKPRPAKLNGYKLTFNYCSASRKGGVANIMECQNHCVYGLLTDIEDNDLEIVSKKEGKETYNEICVYVEQLSDREVIHNVKTHKVTKNKENKNDIAPTQCYRGLIIKNAKKYNFPPEYIKQLEAIPTRD